jgi:hypothetical protein
MADIAVAASRKAQDALGIPKGGVDVALPDSRGEPGIGSEFVSPTNIIKKYPKFA